MEEDAFLRAILADPEDDTVRLVYADWLDERDDPRADYLRLLLKLDHTPTNAPETAGMVTRLCEIQSENQIERRWVLWLCQRRIIKLLRAIQAGEPRDDWPNLEWHRELAQRLDALPIYADMGGIILLRPDGELLGEDHDSENPGVLNDRKWRLIGLTSGVEFFPELRPLLPPRPPNARACAVCGGEGKQRWTVESGRGISPCWVCCGLGWIPLRPPDAPDCVACGGSGRQALVFASGTRDSKPCGECCGWGWLGERLA